MTDEEAEREAWRLVETRPDSFEYTRDVFSTGFRAGLAHERARQAERVTAAEHELYQCGATRGDILDRAQTTRRMYDDTIEECVELEARNKLLEQVAEAARDWAYGSHIAKRVEDALAALDHPTPIEPEAEGKDSGSGSALEPQVPTDAVSKTTESSVSSGSAAVEGVGSDAGVTGGLLRGSRAESDREAEAEIARLVNEKTGPVRKMLTEEDVRRLAREVLAEVEPKGAVEAGIRGVGVTGGELELELVTSAFLSREMWEAWGEFAGWKIAEAASAEPKGGRDEG